MNDIPLCELRPLRRIEAHFDGAYVSLLTKLGHYHPEQQEQVHETAEQEASHALLSQQGDTTLDESEPNDDVDSSEGCTEPTENNSQPDAQDADRDQEPVVPTSLNAELVTMALCFAKLLTKNLLATERATQLEAQVSVLQREICTLRAIAVDSHKLCLAEDATHSAKNGASNKHSKSTASNLIAFKAAVDQELEELIKAQNASMQVMERKFKNQIFGLSLAVDYLKKEIAGRIQQMQIMEAVYDNSKQADRKKMDELSRIWEQVVHEIALNRHKTIVRLGDIACRGQEEQELASGESGTVDTELDSLCSLLTVGCRTTGPNYVNFSKLGQVHFVSLYIEKGKQIGMWISGGAQCHMPLIIQKVAPGSVAAASGRLSPGDIILSIQNFDMIGTSKAYCAQLLKSLSGTIRLGIVRIPVEGVENILANRADFNFELLYGNFPSEEDDCQSGDSGEEEDEEDEYTDSIESGSEHDESEHDRESGTFTSGDSAEGV